MKILVTGGAGYVGSHACKRLNQEGHIPVTMDNLSNGHRNFVKWGPFYNCDIQDEEKLVDILKSEQIEAVMHFAAFAYVGESTHDPLKYYDNNTAGTITLLRAMKRAGVRKIIFSSTCATYGIPNTELIEEETKQQPINPYGSSKLMIEQILKDLCKTGEWSITILRYFNAAGADESGEIGEDHEPETHLIPLAIMACYDPNFTLTVYGDNYPTKDGSCVRDYVHVSDLADAHSLALNIMKEPGLFVFNLGTSEGISVKEIVKAAEGATGRTLKIKIGTRREGDPPVLVASNQKAKDILNWSPKNSSIEYILRTANSWYLKNRKQ